MGEETPAKKRIMIEEIIDCYPDEEFLKADGFDDAIIGVCTESHRLVYSVSKCIEVLRQEMSRDEALEYFYYNVSGAYVGEQTPIWVEDEF